MLTTTDPSTRQEASPRAPTGDHPASQVPIHPFDMVASEASER